MKISIITLFPEMFNGILNSSILKRAQEKGKVEFKLVDLRDFGLGKHKTVDDNPYGGGAGMVIRVDVLDKAIEFAKKDNKGAIVISMDPKGKTFSQALAEDLSCNNLILVCGHYEGIDERARKFIDMEISLGDFVLTGGEIPALAVVDAVSRLIPGVLGDLESSKNESFSLIEGKRLLEHAQYTRPEVYKGDSVPKDLLTGNPKTVGAFRKESSAKETKSKRPDLIVKED